MILLDKLTEALGAAILLLFVALFQGKTMKKVIAWVLGRISRKTTTKLDDKLVKSIEEDWGISDSKGDK